MKGVHQFYECSWSLGEVRCANPGKEKIQGWSKRQTQVLRRLNNEKFVREWCLEQRMISEIEEMQAYELSEVQPAKVE